MAAAFYNQFAGGGARSAGTRPGECVHPEVVSVMREVGVDLSNARPQLLTAELTRDADLLVTMGCGDKCPFVPGLEVQDWPIPDPKGKPLEAVRQIRDEIESRVAALLGQATVHGSEDPLAENA